MSGSLLWSKGEPLDNDPRQAGQPWQPSPHTVSEAVLLKLVNRLIDRDERHDTELREHLENTEELLDEIKEITDYLKQEIKSMSAQLDALTAAVAKNAEVDASAIALIRGIAQQLIAIKDDPVAIQALADELNQKNQTLADAITENTPAG